MLEAAASQVMGINDANKADVETKKFERRRRNSKDLLDTTYLSADVVDVQHTEEALKKDSGESSKAPVAAIAAFKPGVKLTPSRTATEIQIANQGLDDGDAEAIVALLAEGHVTKLNLANNNLGARAAAEIAKCLETNTTLTSLSLHSNGIGDVGAGHFTSFLQGRNASLTSLFLSDNYLGAGVKDALSAANEARTPKLSGLTGLVL